MTVISSQRSQTSLASWAVGIMAGNGARSMLGYGLCPGQLQVLDAVQDLGGGGKWVEGSCQLLATAAQRGKETRDRARAALGSQ